MTPKKSSSWIRRTSLTKRTAPHNSKSHFKIHRSCMKIFAVIVTGAAQPRGSNNRGISDKTLRLVGGASIDEGELYTWKLNASEVRHLRTP